MNKVKSGIILIILFSFLCLVLLKPVMCIFKSITGFFCSACGMTRAFICILHFDFLGAIYNNILSIPIFIFIFYTLIMLFKDFIKNEYSYIPSLLIFLSKYYFVILLLLFISFIFNNLKRFFYLIIQPFKGCFFLFFMLKLLFEKVN